MNNTRKKLEALIDRELDACYHSAQLPLYLPGGLLVPPNGSRISRAGRSEASAGSAGWAQYDV